MPCPRPVTPYAAWFRLSAIALALLALSGCTAMQRATLPALPDREIERHQFAVVRGDDVIGRLAAVRVEPGDTLPDLARHFGLGLNTMSSANPGLDIWVPAADERAILPLSFILPDAPRKGIVVNLATKRLFQFKGEGKSQTVTTYPVGVGAKDRPTPMGQMQVARKAARPTWYVPASIAADHRKKGDILPAKVPPGPENPLGEYALYLSKAGYLIHGTNKPASIGLNASNGCLRLYPEDIAQLFQSTPVATPVLIVNQPYLVGQLDGILYLEAHRPAEGPGSSELERIQTRLKTIESKAARPLDWQKIREIQTEARGIPVAILDLGPGSALEAPPIIDVEHPVRLHGKPEVPDLKPDGWYVLVSDVQNEIDAKRLAAIINHQGPPIPARVVAKGAGEGGYRVIAGPFGDDVKAKDAVKRLKYDLDIDGILIEPDRGT